MVASISVREGNQVEGLGTGKGQVRNSNSPRYLVEGTGGNGVS